MTVAAGGAEYMATLITHKNTIFVAAGDLIGASPFSSPMFTTSRRSTRCR